MNNNETYTLFIYFEFPENFYRALIPNSELSKEDFELFRRVHSKYINSTDTTEEEYRELQHIVDAFCKKPEYLSEENPEGSKWAMRFKDYAIEEDECIEGKIITNQYQAGILL